ncbi:MAG: hypothetical protein NTW02_03870 [Cyanobium sp. LacPavin_0920_WC12_MAG_62_9]|nr:hypothetical protein [Cyanobium sp. LacPavin_0920_WC12_MAG_62_9]
MRTKVFGIGLNKTGTTTLGVCLQRLGYRHTSFSLPLLEQVSRGELAGVLAHCKLFDAFEDWPYPLIYKELDVAFPGSRFVLTRRRSAESWYASLADHALRTGLGQGCRSRRLAYGVAYPQLDEAGLLHRYEQHLLDVRAHFVGREDRLLELCWDEEHDWSRLCAFLEAPRPPGPLPHANAGAGQRARLARLQNGLWLGLLRLRSSQKINAEPTSPDSSYL